MHQQLLRISLTALCGMQLSAFGANKVVEKKPVPIVSLNPSDGYQCIGTISASTNAQIDAQVAKARAAFPAWSSLDIKKRVAILNEVYEAFKKEREKIVALVSREMGMPISVCNLIDMDAGLKYMRGYLDHVEDWLAPEITFQNDQEVHTLFFEGRGVAGVSVAWNYPFCNFIWGVMQNLVVGNTVVFKHSEECPLTGVLLENIIHSTQLPEGVFNAVHGGADVGEYLMNSNIDLIHFTGSTKVGKHLYEVAAHKFIPALLELGGSAPAIVFADADVSLVVDSVYFNRFVNSGQTCDGLKRLIVHQSCLHEVVQGIQNILATKKIGHAEDTSTDIGPLVAARQVAVLEQQVADAIQKGAIAWHVAPISADLVGAYYAPTILTGVTADMRVWKEEVFGPVLPIVTFNTVEEAIALANDTTYGLGGFIYTKNKDLALRVSRQLKTGNITVNGADYVIAEDPFGGCKNSGIGREHGKHGLRELCVAKLVAVK